MTRLVQKPAEVEKLMNALAYGMLNLGFYIEQQAKFHVPVRTGNLRRSIHTVAFRDGKVVAVSGVDLPDYAGEMNGGIGVIVGTNTGYGIFVELGTVKMAARPYLTPAAIAAQQNAVALITAGAKKKYPDVPG